MPQAVRGAGIRDELQHCSGGESGPKVSPICGRLRTRTLPRAAKLTRKIERVLALCHCGAEWYEGSVRRILISPATTTLHKLLTATRFQTRESRERQVQHPQ